MREIFSTETILLLRPKWVGMHMGVGYLVQQNPDFSNHLRKRKLVQINGRFDVKLHHLTCEGKWSFGWIIVIFMKPWVLEIGILIHISW